MLIFILLTILYPQADTYNLPNSPACAGLNETPKVHDIKCREEQVRSSCYSGPVISSLRKDKYFQSKSDTLNGQNVTPTSAPRIPKPLYSPHPAAVRSVKKLKDSSFSTSSLISSRSNKSVNNTPTTNEVNPKKKNGLPALPVRSSPRLKKMALSSSAIPVTALITPSQLRRQEIFEQLTEFALPTKARSMSCISLHACIPPQNKKHENPEHSAPRVSSRTELFHSELPKKRKLPEYDGTPVLPKLSKKSSTTSLRMSGKSMVDMRKAALPVYVPPTELVINNITPVKPKLPRKPSTSRLTKKALVCSPVPRTLRNVASSPNIAISNTGEAFKMFKKAENTFRSSPASRPAVPSTNALSRAEMEKPAEPVDDFAVFHNGRDDESEGYESASEELPKTDVDPQKLLEDDKYLTTSEPLRMDSLESDYYSVSSHGPTPASSISTGRTKFDGVKFKDLNVYYFERDLGCTTVPENGEFSLGMKTEHFTTRKFSLISPRKPNVTLLSVEEEPEEDEVLPEEDDCSMYRLNRIEAKQRVNMLKRLGVQLEKCGLEDIRKSRKVVGCSCVDGICIPETCECSKNGIHCQVDGTSEDGRTTTPCTCDHGDKCDNPNGRSEFRRDVVQRHYSLTFQRIKDMERTGNFSSPKVTKFNEEKERIAPALYFDSIVRKASYSSPSSPAISFDDESSKRFPTMPSLL
ncbi:unnamed protein product [Auanema sp. JU1783]|nr:unnamed protein product [Auanema sp. JU1783]